LLDLSEPLLESIKVKEERAGDRLRVMFSKWLMQVDPRPTWAALTEAVDVIDPTKAQQIRTRYIDI
jgi:hypothetical protein